MTTIEQVLALQTDSENIRCIAVIAHVDHGKTTLCDSLLAKAGLIDEDQSGDKRELDTLPDEKERGITIKSTAISMCFEHKERGKNYLVNLVDSPGHIDFSSEVTAALRICDGAVVVVDCVEGVCVQTETVLRQALAERVKPVLVINKVDRAILELQLDPEEAYQRFMRTIESVNVIVSTFSDPALGDLEFSPEKGNVLFGSGYHGWGFTLHQWARKVAQKEGGDPSKIVKRLWGDHFWDPETKKLSQTQTSPSGKTLERYACKYMLAPLFKLVRGIGNKNWEDVTKLLSIFDAKLTPNDQEHVGRMSFKKIMRKIFNIGDGLVDLIGWHLPSPKQAQQYRVEVLYEGAMDDEVAQAVRNCDPNGPVALYVSKMVPSPHGGQFFAFGRLFSGTLRTGQPLYVLDPNNPQAKGTKNVTSIKVMMGRSAQSVPDVVCGNTVAVTGFDQLLKYGTLTSSPNGAPFRAMKFTVSPVVRTTVAAKNPADLPKLIAGLRLLSKSDPLAQVITEESGAHVLCCCGELHLEVSLSMLRSEFCKGIEIVTAEPVVPFRETVSNTSKVCLVKSPNGHNRLYGTATPLPSELCDQIENKVVDVSRDSEARAQFLMNQFGWDSVEAKKKIWCFGPLTNPTNVVVDVTKGNQFLHEIKDSVVASFHWSTSTGPLCEETVRGVRLNLVDVELHADAIHRGDGQIMPPFRRLVQGSILSAEPRILEPIYLVEISTTVGSQSGVYSVISHRRGQIISEERREGTNLVIMRAYLPVLDSFGLTSALRAACHGQAFPQCVMDHWEIIADDPFQMGSFSNKIVTQVRTRKGLNKAIPDGNHFLDKL